jgi:hypothetical protein
MKGFAMQPWQRSTLILFSLLPAWACSRAIVQSSSPTSIGKSTTGVTYCLPRTLLKLAVTKEAGEGDKVELEPLAPIADADACYVAVVNHSLASTDKVTISTTPEGLLKSIEAVGEDTTPKIILKLGELAKEVAKAFVQFPAADTAPREKTHREFVFDPTVQAQLNEVDRALSGIGYRLQVTPLKTAQQADQAGVRAAAQQAGGVLYRRPIPYMVSIAVLPSTRGATPGAGRTRVATEEVLLARVFNLPNDGPIEAINLSGGAFVETSYTLTFTDGMPTEVKAAKPSEVLAAVSILPELAKTITSIPAELVQLKIDYSTKQQELLDAQKTVIESQRALAALNEPKPTPAPGGDLNAPSGQP